jgi:predicted GNAT family acetyltransferase
MMQIRHEETGRKGAFFIEENGQRNAELQYFKSAPQQLTIYHTEVGEQFRGQGIGRDLVSAAVDYARANSLKIIPKCPYAKKIIDETPEFGDVLA